MLKEKKEEEKKVEKVEKVETPKLVLELDGIQSTNYWGREETKPITEDKLKELL